MSRSIPMNRKQIAQALDVSEKSVSRYVASGRLPDRRVKGALDVLEDDVERLRLELETPVLAPVAHQDGDETHALVVVPPANVVRRDTHLTLDALARAVVAIGERMDAGHSATGQVETPVKVSEKLLLSLDEAAALSGLPKSRLRAAIGDGELEARRIGRGFKMRPGELARFVASLFNATDEKELSR